MPSGTYRVWLRNDFGELIDLLALDDLQKRFLRSRWLDQVVWAEERAAKEQQRYYVLRVMAILGGVLIPALVSLDVGGNAAEWVRWLAFAVGLVVAAAVALEGFFRFGERWRHYRRTAELLKIEGWQFFQSSGAYQGTAHAAAFPAFAARTEAIIQHDLDVYISVVAAENKEQNTPGSAAG